MLANQKQPIELNPIFILCKQIQNLFQMSLHIPNKAEKFKLNQWENKSINIFWYEVES